MNIKNFDIIYKTIRRIASLYNLSELEKIINKNNNFIEKSDYIRIIRLISYFLLYNKVSLIEYIELMYVVCVLGENKDIFEPLLVSNSNYIGGKLPSFIESQDFNGSLNSQLQSLWEYLYSCGIEEISSPILPNNLLSLKNFELVDIFDFLVFRGKDPENLTQLQDLNINLNEDIYSNGEYDYKDKINKGNLDIITKNNNTLWIRGLHDDGVALPGITSKGCLKTVPIGSIALNLVIGGPVIHVYNISGILFCPIYAAMCSSLIELKIFFPSLLKSISIKKNSSRIDNFDKTIYTHSANITNSIKNFYLSLNDTSFEDKNSVAVIFAQKINYGHTIINEIGGLDACLQYLKLYPNKLLNIIIGKYDYFEYEKIIKTWDKNLSINIINDNSINTGNSNCTFYKGITLLPVSSLRPTKKALYFLKPKIGNNSQKTMGLNSSIYISLDNRGGKRRCLNKLDLIKTIVETNKFKYIILDGITAIPGSLKNEENYLHCDDINNYEIDDLINKANKIHVKIIIIDKMLFSKKKEILGKYHPILAITPYGSSMILPVYILNIPTLVYGHEPFGVLVDDWAWHVSKYCHADRLIDIIYVKSSSFNEDGYFINTYELTYATQIRNI